MPLEYTARWTGGRIGSGATVFHFRPVGGAAGAQAAATACRDFINAIRAYLPASVTVSFDPEARLLSVDGTLEAVYPIVPPAAVVGSGPTTFANGTGVLIRYSTAAIAAGRRLQGRMFLVPAVSGVFAVGEVTAAVRGAIDAAGATFLTALNSAGPGLVVWSRTAQVFADVTAIQTQSRPTVLKTRNDRD